MGGNQSFYRMEVEVGQGHALNGVPKTFRHVTHLRSIFLMYWRAVGIQYVWRICIRVWFNPACCSFSCASLTTSKVKWWFGGKSMGNVAECSTGAL